VVGVLDLLSTAPEFISHPLCCAGSVGYTHAPLSPSGVIWYSHNGSHVVWSRRSVVAIAMNHRFCGLHKATTRQPCISCGLSGRLEQSTTGHSFSTYIINVQKHAQDTSFLTFLLNWLTVSRVRAANIARRPCIVTLAMLLRLINRHFIIIIVSRLKCGGVAMGCTCPPPIFANGFPSPDINLVSFYEGLIDWSLVAPLA